MSAPRTLILGVDFTSAPRPKKPITAASGHLRRDVLEIEALETFDDFHQFEELLARPGPWIGGFDFPFGQPRALLRALGWPTDWAAMVTHCATLDRVTLRRLLDDYRATRPAGAKYLHRETDRPAGSSSPMKLVNPPVALMFHEGAPRLLRAGVHIPELRRGDPARVALEAYPGFLARAITRSSYKNDSRAMQTPGRQSARGQILDALQSGSHPLGLRLALRTKLLHRQALADASGDTLDAMLCAVQAGWAAGRPGYGLPPRVPRAEGWIIGAPQERISA